MIQNGVLLVILDYLVKIEINMLLKILLLKIIFLYVLIWQFIFSKLKKVDIKILNIT